MIYEIIKLSSVFIRQYFLPNPFSNLFNDPNIAYIVNLIFGGGLVPFAYFLTGTWYDKKIKAIGSFGFLVNYSILTFIFLEITKYISNINIVILVSLISYILLCIIEKKLLGNKSTFKY